MTATGFTTRLATVDDIPAIESLMRLSIAENMKAFLSPASIEAARATMGLDRTLIADGCYFLIESEVDGASVLVGCGGWSRRRTLYGGDHTAGRDDSFSDPAHEAARIRAMYAHPGWTRRGVGTLLIELGENAARAAGFKMIDLGATLPGEPLYRARGYVELSRQTSLAANGGENTIIHMRKTL